MEVMIVITAQLDGLFDSWDATVYTGEYGARRWVGSAGTASRPGDVYTEALRMLAAQMTGEELQHSED